MRNILICLLFFVSVSHADDLKIYSGMWSHHTAERFDGKAWNEDHNLLAIQYNNWYVATYNNSFDRRSNAVGYMTDQRCLNTMIEVCASVALGFVTGYYYHEKEQVLPFILPKLQIQAYNNIWLDFSAAPTIESKGWVFTFGIMSTY